MNMLGMILDSWTKPLHWEVQNAKATKSEKIVKKAQAAIVSFLNPFAIDEHDQLFILSSGAASSLHVQNHVLQAESIGRCAKEEFIMNQLAEQRNFFSPIKWQELKTLEDMHKKG